MHPQSDATRQAEAMVTEDAPWQTRGRDRQGAFKTTTVTVTLERADQAGKTENKTHGIGLRFLQAADQFSTKV